MSNFNTRVHTSSSLPLLVGAAKTEQIRTAPSKPGTDPTAFDRVLDRQQAEQRTSTTRSDRRDNGRDNGLDRSDADRSAFQPNSTRDRNATADRQNDNPVTNDKPAADRRSIGNDAPNDDAAPTNGAPAAGVAVDGNDTDQTKTNLEGEIQPTDEVSAAAAAVAALLVSAPVAPVADEVVVTDDSELTIEVSADAAEAGLVEPGLVEPVNTDGSADTDPVAATRVAQTTQMTETETAEGLDVGLLAAREAEATPSTVSSANEGEPIQVETAEAESAVAAEQLLLDATVDAAPTDGAMPASGTGTATADLAPAGTVLPTTVLPTTELPTTELSTTEAAPITDLPAENLGRNDAPAAATLGQVVVESDTEDSPVVDDLESVDGGEATTDEQQPLAQAAPAAEATDQDENSGASDGESSDLTAETPEAVAVADPGATAPAQPNPTTATSARADGVTGIAPAAPQTATPVAEPVAAPTTASFDGEVWEQVQKAVGLVRQSGQGRHEVSLILRPDELGSVAVELVQNGDEVAVRIVTQTSAAQDRLDRGRLLAELQSAGIDPASVEIDHRGANGSGDGRNEGNGSSLGSNGSGTSDDRSDPPPVRRREPRGFTSSGGLDLAL